MNPLNVPITTPHMKDTVYPFSFFSKISSKDKRLVIKAVRKHRPESINYEDSWGYIIQATRYEGFKWYDPKTESLIFFGRKSRSDNTLVVSSFFADLEYLAAVIELVQDALKAPKTILKNIDTENIKNIMPYGFRKYRKTEKWSIEAKYDDQTFPQVILDLNKLIEMEGRNYHLLRKALNKKPELKIRKYRNSDREAVLKIFDLKDGVSKDTLRKAKGVYYESHAMYPDAALDKFVVTLKDTQEIVGFTATSDISQTITHIVASIYKPGIRIASIWGMFQTLVIKHKEGFKLANLGGSETQMIFTFKCEKFPPAKLLEKTHLVYNA